ncbi:MAG: NADH-quinone oxidoreductase subunit NuoG [Gammaproteobacteria bacterium]|nr:NADH-quinone oxidoreductase subunit NuoG [Gammaproteobacteria bacterium]
MAILSIDGVDYEVEEGENLLHAVLSQKIDLPYFCWHPSLGSVGACRQCAVIEYAGPDDDRGRLQMACMTSVSDGMRVSVSAQHAANFRSSVIEWLMENHPHDCPVCEEGGECHLQDMTVMTGHSMRRFRGRKRTWRNQDLGPFIGHEMNRCITCYRCVRFYGDYAGGKDLAAFGSRGRMFFGRFENGTLESEFAGNLVEVCPTGVFTDKPFSTFYTRKWDLQTAPSICPGCSVGCNTFPSERYGKLRRITNRYHGELNRYFLCDRGRFGSHYVNHETRVLNAGISNAEGVFEFGDPKKVVNRMASKLSTGAIGIGSPRASFEANFALRQLVGLENYCAGIKDEEFSVLKESIETMRQGGFSVPTLEQVEQCDASFILGEDISNTAPRLALAVRQATRLVSYELAGDAGIPVWQDAGVRGHAQHSRNPLYIATPASTRLDDIATKNSSGSVAQLVELANSIADLVESEAYGDDFASSVAKSLVEAKAPLIVTGSSLESVELIRAAARIAKALQRRDGESQLAIVPSEVNSFGSALLDQGVSLSHALSRLESGGTVIVLENDLYTRTAADVVDRAMSASEFITIDSLETPTMAKSKCVFPAATYAEQTGTFVNYELRAQRYFQVFEPTGEVQPSWKWLVAAALESGRNDMAWSSQDALARACAESTFPQIERIAPPAEFRLADGSKIPRQTHRYSGRTAMNADVDVHEPKTSVDTESPFSYSMEGLNPGDQNGATIPYSWSPGWNSNQSVFKFQQEVGGRLAGGDPGVRLVEVSRTCSADVAKRVPENAPVSNGGNGSLELVPVHLVFGSDELSRYSWPIAKRTPAPFVLLSETDAERLGLQSGMGVRVKNGTVSVEVRIDERLASGLLGVPKGLVDWMESQPSHVELDRDPDFVPPSELEANVIARG